MPLIEWSDELSVGIAQFDRQHKGIIDVIYNLSDAITENRSEAVIKDIILDLKAYVNFHFSMEEKYFDKYDYPDTKSHKLEHKKFADKVNAENFSAPEEMLDFLLNWLKKHILISDKKYKSYFNNRGLR